MVTRASHCPFPGPRSSPVYLPMGTGKGSSRQQVPEAWGWMRETERTCK